eukprot:gene54276-74329_t
MDGHLGPMTKMSNRDRILTEGLKVVHAHGYAGASVRDIVQAAGVPQGSFTNHFTSKEAFGVDIEPEPVQRWQRVVAQRFRHHGPAVGQIDVEDLDAE